MCFELFFEPKICPSKGNAGLNSNNKKPILRGSKLRETLRLMRHGHTFVSPFVKGRVLSLLALDLPGEGNAQPNFLGEGVEEERSTDTRSFVEC